MNHDDNSFKIDDLSNFDPLSQLLRKKARQLLYLAVDSECEIFLEAHSNQRTTNGRRRVVRNGYHPKREILTGIGPVEVQVPKVRAQSGEPVSFHSKLVPPYVRKTDSLEAAVPWFYLNGISSNLMNLALSELVGAPVSGFSPSVTDRLRAKWDEEYQSWRQQDLSDRRWVYLWGDGIYLRTQGSQGEKLCMLVLIGVDENGNKHLLELVEGVRESKQSWIEILLDLKERGLKAAPKLAIGDGALGFWGALNEQFPSTQHQRCWVHKTANILNYMPKSVQPRVKKALREIWMAETY